MIDNKYYKRYVKPSMASKTCNVRKSPTLSGTILYTQHQIDSAEYKALQKKGLHNGLVSTGNIEFDGKYKWFQVVFVKPLTTGEYYGYVREDVVYVDTSNQVSDQYENVSASLTYMHDLETFHLLLEMGQKIKDLKAKNVDVTNYESKFNSLLSSYNERQKYINEAIKGKVKETRGVQKSYVNKYNALSIENKLGIAPLVIIACVLIFSVVTGVTLYKIFGPAANAAKFDLDKAENLKALLETVSAEDKEKILKEVDEQVNDAYNKGASVATKKFIKTMAIVGLGFFAGKAMFSSTSKN